MREAVLCAPVEDEDIYRSKLKAHLPCLLSCSLWGLLVLGFFEAMNAPFLGKKEIVCLPHNIAIANANADLEIQSITTAE